jgi:hypothetical protein
MLLKQETIKRNRIDTLQYRILRGKNFVKIKDTDSQLSIIVSLKHYYLIPSR